MYRNRGDASQDHFDMLPFISILMCTLGALLFVTLSVSALSLGPDVGEGWLPTNFTSSKVPVLIEWDGSLATVHRDNRKIPVQWSSSKKSPEFEDLLHDLSVHSKSQYALLAVRPSGFATFNEFAEDFRERHIDIGYEPIEQNRSVRLILKGKHP